MAAPPRTTTCSAWKQISSVIPPRGSCYLDPLSLFTLGVESFPRHPPGCGTNVTCVAVERDINFGSNSRKGRKPNLGRRKPHAFLLIPLPPALLLVVLSMVLTAKAVCLQEVSDGGFCAFPRGMCPRGRDSDKEDYLSILLIYEV